jgi:hypothetical protein
LLRTSIASTKLISKSTVELRWPIDWNDHPPHLGQLFEQGRENKQTGNDESAVWQLTRRFNAQSVLLD